MCSCSSAFNFSVFYRTCSGIQKIYYIVIKIQNTTFAVVYFTLVAAASDTSSIVLDL